MVQAVVVPDLVRLVEPADTFWFGILAADGFVDAGGDIGASIFSG